MFVKPAEGRTVRRPDTLVYLRKEGEEVPDGDLFWVRRLRDGDVEEAIPPGPDEAGKTETVSALLPTEQLASAHDQVEESRP